MKSQVAEIQRRELGIQDLQMVLLVSPFTLFDIYSSYLQALKPYTRVISMKDLNEYSTLELANLHVDLVVLDPTNDYTNSIFKLSQLETNVKWVFVAPKARYLDVKMAVEFGAKGFITWDASIQEIIHRLISLADGTLQEFWSDEAKEHFEGKPSIENLVCSKQIDVLTSRQIEVLIHLSHGKSVKEIAELMSLSTKSIDSHKYRIMNKLDIHDRVLLARYAIREGLVDP